jgi:putative addiction module component (TIGR02574 family)
MDKIARLLQLPPGERIELARGWWDRLRPEDLPALSAEQEAEIERRLAEHARDPTRSSDWADVKQRLWSRRK